MKNVALLFPITLHEHEDNTFIAQNNVYQCSKERNQTFGVNGSEGYYIQFNSQMMTPLFFKNAHIMSP